MYHENNLLNNYYQTIKMKGNAWNFLMCVKVYLCWIDGTQYSS